MKIIGNAEIETAVATFFQRYGKDSAHQAALRAEELEDYGEYEDAELWHSIEIELKFLSNNKGQLH